MAVPHLIKGYSKYLLEFLADYADELSFEDYFLDVGCGHMRNLKLLIEIGFENLYGLDRELTTHGIPIKGFIHGTLEDNLPFFRDRTFDVVVCNFVLMFVDPLDIEDSVNHLARITGKFLVIETNKKTHKNEKTFFKDYDFRQILTLIESMDDFVILHKSIAHEKIIAKREGL